LAADRVDPGLDPRVAAGAPGGASTPGGAGAAAAPGGGEDRGAAASSAQADRGATTSSAQPSRGTLIDYLTLALLTLIWSTTWAAIRIGLRGIPPFTGVALRFGIGAVALLVLARALGVRLGAGASPWRVWLFNGVLTFFIAYGVLYWAEQWVPSGLASVLFATSPLWVALAAHVALPGERLNVATAAGVAIGFGGVALIFSDDLRALGGPHVAGAAALLLISPLASAIGVVGVKRWGAGMHPLSTAAVPMVLTAGAMGCVALAAEHGQPVTFGVAPVAALLYLALCGSALAFTLYFWLLGRLPATTLSLINYLTPVLALWIGSSALHEAVTPRTLGGSALVVGGVAVALRARQRRPGGAGH
jgi:drug/metabolite transporter (DMT)-like permease